MSEDFSNLSMLELFRVETEHQAGVLTEGLLELEKFQVSSVESSAGEDAGGLKTENLKVKTVLEDLMRAAHSLKGAARIVNLSPAVRLAHGMEDCFVAAQKGLVRLEKEQIDLLLRGVDLLVTISRRDESNIADWEKENSTELTEVHLALASPGKKKGASGELESKATAPTQTSPSAKAEKRKAKTETSQPAEKPEVRSQKSDLSHQASAPVRLTAENLNRLLGLAGESLVESRWLRPFTEAMQRLKRMQSDLERTLEQLRTALAGDGATPSAESCVQASRARVNELFAQTAAARAYLGERLQELDLFDRRSAHLSNRLYLEVLRARMRPFGDGARGFARMVRDVARSLGKQVRFELVGEQTQVDRDILDRLEAPLSHLLRNAVDHGCESAEARVAAGKPAEASVRLEARHSAGMLQIVVSDDGAGVDVARARAAVVEKKLATAELVEKMGEAEVLQFLFLPGFSLRDSVTEISGRGVGLDIVQNLVKQVRGSMRVSTQVGRGTRFVLQLPLTLSVLRTLLVEIGGEPYAIPLAQIVRTLKLGVRSEKLEASSQLLTPNSPLHLSTIEGRLHFRLGEEQIGLVSAGLVLGIDARRENVSREWSVVVLGEGKARYGLIVDKFLGERELVVQPLDSRLGKVKDISAAATMEDGSPVLIVDVEDLVRSIEKLVAAGTMLNGGRVDKPAGGGPSRSSAKRKRVLAVDDSLTVRELERKLLLSRNYDADVAVDGMEAWNLARSGEYDLVITDVDMPRMDGIELTSLIKADPQLKSLPVMIVSYKDRPEDRVRGLEAGADYYLTKGSFQDETWLAAVDDLIGEAEA